MSNVPNQQAYETEIETSLYNILHADKECHMDAVIGVCLVEPYRSMSQELLRARIEAITYIEELLKEML